MIDLIASLGEAFCSREVSVNLGWVEISFYKDNTHLIEVAGVKVGTKREYIKDSKINNECE